METHIFGSIGSLAVTLWQFAQVYFGGPISVVVDYVSRRNMFERYLLFLSTEKAAQSCKGQPVVAFLCLVLSES